MTFNSRIRTFKPEWWESEDLASVSLTAERTFQGLLTLSDDAGRCKDHSALIHGRLWALRPSHTVADVAEDLRQLAEAGLICRYTGCDGRSYLHVVTWDKHQKIDRPTPSRIPACPDHASKHQCGGCGTPACTNPHPALAEKDSVDPRRVLDRVESPNSTRTAGQETPTAAMPPAEQAIVTTAETFPAEQGEAPAQSLLAEDSTHPIEPSPSGSRILDPGSVPNGRTAPAPDTPQPELSAKALLGEYISACNRRPPENTLGQLGKQIKILLGEGFHRDEIRPALDKLRAKGLHPSVLPSLVNELLNATPQQAAAAGASGGAPWARTTASSGYQPYLNPDAPAPATFGIGGRQ